jgi:hypothetical protein
MVTSRRRVSNLRGSMSLAAALRCELAVQAEKYARSEGIPLCFSYGEAPVVCFSAYEGDTRHGNFLYRSYTAIKAMTEWRKRLAKVHTSAKRSFPATERGRRMELDTCTSSDALLMNIFCYPSVFRDGRIAALLGTPANVSPEFGFKARVPLLNGRFDGTEVDLRLGDLLIEAKLAENDFQNAEKSTLQAYRDFSEVFECKQLPRIGRHYAGYQLIRNVLAAHALDCSFCVLVDSRRPDLAEAWYAVMRCVKSSELKTRLRVSTWQELAGLAPSQLRGFLKRKYGIEPTSWG